MKRITLQRQLQLIADEWGLCEALNMSSAAIAECALFDGISSGIVLAMLGMRELQELETSLILCGLNNQYIFPYTVLILMLKLEMVRLIFGANTLQIHVENSKDCMYTIRIEGYNEVEY